jgi:hypothetical protein
MQERGIGPHLLRDISIRGESGNIWAFPRRLSSSGGDGHYASSEKYSSHNVKPRVGFFLSDQGWPEIFSVSAVTTIFSVSAVTTRDTLGWLEGNNENILVYFVVPACLDPLEDTIFDSDLSSRGEHTLSDTFGVLFCGSKLQVNDEGSVSENKSLTFGQLTVRVHGGRSAENTGGHFRYCGCAGQKNHENSENDDDELFHKPSF